MEGGRCCRLEQLESCRQGLRNLIGISTYAVSVGITQTNIFFPRGTRSLQDDGMSSQTFGISEIGVLVKDIK